MSKPAIVAAILPAAARWWTTRFAQLQYLNRMPMRFIIPVTDQQAVRTRLLGSRSNDRAS